MMTPLAKLWELSDLELGMGNSRPVEDLLAVLHDRPLGDLEGTLRALREGRLVRRMYHVNGRGCLVFHLTSGSIRSKTDLLAFAFSSDAVGLAARRLVRWFDADQLSDQAIEQVLTDQIVSRQEVNRLEDEAIERVALQSV